MVNHTHAIALKYLNVTETNEHLWLDELDILPLQESFYNSSKNNMDFHGIGKIYSWDPIKLSIVQFSNQLKHVLTFNPNFYGAIFKIVTMLACFFWIKALCPIQFKQSCASTRRGNQAQDIFPTVLNTQHWRKKN